MNTSVRPDVRSTSLVLGTELPASDLRMVRIHEAQGCFQLMSQRQRLPGVFSPFGNDLRSPNAAKQSMERGGL